MKILNGSELVGYIKERQAKQVRGLRQAWGVYPKLAILVASNDPVIDLYVRLKEAYGRDLLIEVDVHRVAQSQLSDLIKQLNADNSVHGIIVQLPLPDPAVTNQIVSQIDPQKDVDGLASLDGRYVSATATAIDWLLAGYNVLLSGKKIAVVGSGRLVGAPLSRMWQKVGYNVTTYDDTVANLAEELNKAEVIVSATGVPGLIKANMVPLGAVVVDAGTAASENGQVVGDIDPSIRDRQDLTMTPLKGGVGPLTIAALFENVMTAARGTITTEQQNIG